MKTKKKIIGLIHGVFDVIHVGHINYFKEAKSKVDKLIVSVTSDEFVTFLGERSSLTYEKIDTSTKVLGYIAGTVKSVQSNWNVPSFQSDHTTNVINPQKRKEVLQSIKNNK